MSDIKKYVEDKGKRISKPATISEKSLDMLYRSVRNFKSGKKGKPVNMETKFKDKIYVDR